MSIARRISHAIRSTVLRKEIGLGAGTLTINGVKFTHNELTSRPLSFKKLQKLARVRSKPMELHVDYVPEEFLDFKVVHSRFKSM